jgi:hypothetical protein
MFNNYQESNTTNKFNFNINAVSGTLRKSHPKSRMTIQELKDANYLFNAEQPKKFIKTETKEVPDWRGNPYGVKSDVFENVVVLQVMLLGDGRGIIEYVAEKDFMPEEDGDCNG